MDRFVNYELLEERMIEDVHAKGYVLRHVKSGARVVVLSNDDDNKVFSIGFRTTPMEDTGVPHILEHSVLCGSKLFPVKDPFIELAKGSLNTFLNAMTYPDKTLYPIASYNDKDFRNLMHIYMDAVFYPNITLHDKSFRQEGWHYELESLDAPLEINGVVYNEMKGAYSSGDEILQAKITQTLFPDNTYGHDSGGDPWTIPELTYEHYLDFYHTYYHPSNSYIYLYGDLDMEKALANGLNKNNEHLYSDYLDFAERLHLNMKDKRILYPKDIVKSHNELMHQVETIENQEIIEKIKNRYEELKKNSYKDDKFVIFPVPTMSDLIKESEVQDICIRNYNKRYADAETDLYFMRKVKDITTPLVAIEVRNNEIIQSRGKKNNDPTKAQQAFITKWETKVLKGSVLYA